MRRNLLRQCDVHTLLRLPTGIFYAQGVKANVLFFDGKPARRTPWTERALGLRPADEHALHAEDNPLKRADLDEFVACYNPERPAQARGDGARSRPSTTRIVRAGQGEPRHLLAAGQEPGGSEDLPPPDVLAEEIADDLQAALEQFAAIHEILRLSATE